MVIKAVNSGKAVVDYEDSAAGHEIKKIWVIVKKMLLN